MANEYYQSAYTGDQIDNTLGRIINGEFDNTAENAEIAARSAEIAKEAQAGAEKARDEAVGIVGGDYIPNGGGQVTGDYTLQGNVNMTGALQVDSPSQYGSLRTEGSMIAFTGRDGATIYVGGNGNVGEHEIIQNDVPTLTILDNNDSPVRINGVLDPAGEYDAANKQYVDSRVQTYVATVTTDWLADDANGGFTQTVAADGILSTDNPIADIVMGDDVAANELYAKAWSCITRIVTDDDMVTLYANGSAPTTAFTMQLKVVR